MKFQSWFVFLLLCFMGSFTTAQAQISNVHIGVNGLTCSQCTRNVEMSLRKLSFVQDVAMNLEHTDGQIILKPNAKFDPIAIANAIKDAGFSVRFLKAVIAVTKAGTTNNTCFQLSGNSFQLIPQSPTAFSGNQSIQFIGEGFLPAGELKKWKSQLAPQCTVSSSKLYFITPIKDAG